MNNRKLFFTILHSKDSNIKAPSDSVSPNGLHLTGDAFACLYLFIYFLSVKERLSALFLSGTKVIHEENGLMT